MCIEEVGKGIPSNKGMFGSEVVILGVVIVCQSPWMK
jgi:hypothetical protein